MNAIALTIREGMEQGLFQKEHPMVVADTLWGICSGIFLYVESQPQLNNKKKYVKKRLETAFDILINGLKVNSKKMTSPEETPLLYNEVDVNDPVMAALI